MKVEPRSINAITSVSKRVKVPVITSSEEASSRARIT
ncbi:hypothetical protein F383_37885 [Gossypium arboreum]|uniref:Uncharacterized protein n=1 Tax=Gossypium arboreum TaxID=29729 RepID=A0A0B0M8U0_GOSAR|nr:hypothetical protein F383_37885 [Gossypium arboreum]